MPPRPAAAAPPSPPDPMPVTVATWNVNSVKARLPHLFDWLAAAEPDVVLLQETKCVNEEFPRLELESLGWHLALRGQKTYNGVAILSRHAIVEEIASLDGDDGESRYIEAKLDNRSEEHTS